jgi:hypothetical protein
MIQLYPGPILEVKQKDTLLVCNLFDFGRKTTPEGDRLNEDMEHFMNEGGIEGGYCLIVVDGEQCNKEYR